MGEEITISYDSLFDLVRREKSREELQKIEDSFYTDVAQFLTFQERNMMNLPHGNEYEKAKIQLNNMKKLLRELYEKRERKIINLVLYKVKSGTSLVDLSPLLPEEQVFFEKTYQLLMQGRESIIEPVLQGKTAVMDILLHSLEKKQDTAAILKTDETPEAQGKDDGFPAAPEVKAPEPKLSVKLLMDLPEFLGRDMEVYGPFKEGDVAEFSESVAKVLVGKNAGDFI
jgi:DNA replication initiation complex subunit (GINS family)